VEQLVFELAAPEPPRFDNFLPGRNVELIAALRLHAEGASSDTGLLLWGPPAAGKTHLLHACVAHAQACGRAVYLTGPDATPASGYGGADLVAVDSIDTADATTAGALFTLFNELKARGGRLVAASREPLASLHVREDLRTRLGWGLVYEVLPLTDEEASAALATHAAERGFRLSADVLAYLLRHGRRDMRSLLATLAELDRRSLATRRPITVARVREWLAPES
jgi:DnaA family protein